MGVKALSGEDASPLERTTSIMTHTFSVADPDRRLTFSVADPEPTPTFGVADSDPTPASQSTLRDDFNGLSDQHTRLRFQLEESRLRFGLSGAVPYPNVLRLEPA